MGTGEGLQQFTGLRWILNRQRLDRLSQGSREAGEGFPQNSHRKFNPSSRRRGGSISHTRIIRAPYFEYLKVRVLFFSS
jgi:hypothetical protein